MDLWFFICKLCGNDKSEAPNEDSKSCFCMQYLKIFHSNILFPKTVKVVENMGIILKLILDKFLSHLTS